MERRNFATVSERVTMQEALINVNKRNFKFVVTQKGKSELSQAGLEITSQTHFYDALIANNDQTDTL